MKNLIMYPHGGSYNHGCEAIVKTTADLMQQINPNFKNNTTLLSFRPSEDKEFDVEHYCKILSHNEPVKRFSATYLQGIVQRHLIGDKTYFDRMAYRNLINNTDKDTLALSIGGDNYCYGIPREIYFMNQLSRKNKAKTVLWGCSIEPTAIDNEMLSDLKQYHLIFARESITYQALSEKGLENIRLCPDPAFLLEPEKTTLPKNFVPGKTIGINISPLISAFETKEGMAFENYCNLILNILKKTSYHISLIPHVMWDHNDDRIPLKNLNDYFQGNERISFASNNNELNSGQLKYIISKCKVLVTARTHASIAAYSQGVPTLVVGYSVKAKGIAKDLFGSENGYVLPVQKLHDGNELSKEFFNFMDGFDTHKTILNKIIPNYKRRIIKEVRVLKTI
ncbi:polysaccharide pyruvyl transferase family protein [Robertkochia marina]|uniref:Polysaccharide pyruvyl transferase family protein n=1 Tax=Robertkochia marina TaxID=1227945 RepID=A0A4S3M1D3_9FLAO|nr:polysaccharide pyruvyl transferase family protein [Robertkochia marina]THD66783.1 polysaccharide pyruvyl transferase family protein [Robertkochia marina]TRZ41926.1 polysaccharide pyruvyl transferase family protein [Robertkochia marina]